MKNVSLLADKALKELGCFSFVKKRVEKALIEQIKKDASIAADLCCVDVQERILEQLK